MIHEILVALSLQHCQLFYRSSCQPTGLFVCLSTHSFDSAAETAELISTKLGSFYVPLKPNRITHNISDTPPGGRDIEEKKLGGKSTFHA
jgi:hypothetical protein